MKSQELEFTFDRTGASADAEALVDFFKQEFPDWPVRRVTQTSALPRGVTLRGEMLDLITLLISIPASTLATWDLAVRLQLKQKIEKLIAWAKERRARGQRNPFVVLPPDNKVVSLDQAQPDQLLDAITAQADKSQKGNA